MTEYFLIGFFAVFTASVLFQLAFIRSNAMNKFYTVIKLAAHYHVLGVKRFVTGLKIRAILS